jgi:hypothetical protein
MSGFARLGALPLPRSWPRRVHSAVVQVISLVRTSLAVTQGWASESMNPELRQQSEEARLQTDRRHKLEFCARY